MSIVHHLAAATLALLASAALPSTAAAHAELVEAEPADGAVLDAPPREVVLTFDGELDPDVSRFTVTDAAGDVVGHGGVDLEVADRNVLRGDVATDVGGRYTIAWTVTGTDGHPIDGTFAFSVASADVAVDEAPDTALGAGGFTTVLVAAGAALVAAAVVSARLRLRNDHA